MTKAMTGPHHLLLVALAVACICNDSVWCLDFKLGAIVEEGTVSADTISNTVQRIVNDDWLYFSAGSNHRMVHEIQVVPAGKSVVAVQKACTWQNVSALLGIGGCNLIKCVRDLGQSLGVPTVVVPVGLCDIAPDSNFVVVGRESLSQQVSAAVAAIEAEKVTEVAVIYDDEQNFQVVQDFLSRITEKRIAANTFLATVGNATKVVLSLMSGSARLVAVLASARGIKEILLAANATGATRVDFQWLSLDTGVSTAQLLSWLPTSTPVNLLLVRSSTRGLLSSQTCPDQLAAVVGPACRSDSVTPAQLQAIDALLALASSMVKLNASDPASASLAGCQRPGAWPAGVATSAQLRSNAALGLLGYNVSFDSASHLSSTYVELVSTSSSLFSDSVRFVETGRFDTASQKLSVSFVYKSSRLLFANKFMDFKGRILTVCSTAVSPYTVYTNVSNGFGGKVIEGYNADMLSVLESALNFRSLVRPPTSNVATAGNQAGCIGDVARGTADFALLFGLNSGAYSSVDFSSDILPMSHTILVKRPAQATALWNVFLPFTYDVWLLLIGMFIVVSMILYLVAYYSPFSAWNLGLSFAIADEIWYKEYLWSLVGSFLQQGQDFFPFAASPRTILSFWWLFTVVIFGTYTGELAAELTITIQHHPVKSLTELANDPAYVVHVVAGSSIHNSILTATAGVLKDLRRKLAVVDSDVACAETLLNTQYTYQVCIMDQNLNAYYATNFCHQTYMTSDYFNPSFNGVVFPKNAYYISAFNRALQKAKQTGIANLIRLRYFPTTNPECHVPEVQMTTAAITLEGIGGTCFLTIGLYVIGMLLLGLELFWTDICKKQPLDFMCF